MAEKGRSFKRAGQIVIIVSATALLTGCPLKEVLDKVVDNVLKQELETGPPKKIAVLEYYEHCSDPWFCGSKAAERAQDAAVEGVQEAAKGVDNMRYVGRESDKEFYKDFVGASHVERERMLEEKANEMGATHLVFGRYKGGDFKVTVRAYLYSTQDSAYAKSDRQTFNKEDSKVELGRKIHDQAKELVRRVGR